jgi:hypothetical protein
VSNSINRTEHDALQVEDHTKTLPIVTKVLAMTICYNKPANVNIGIILKTQDHAGVASYMQGCLLFGKVQ